MGESPREALVIGNDTYKCGPLTCCVNDATGVRDALQSIGFHVRCETNLCGKEMKTLANEFISSMAPGTIALFFFAGHGSQYNGVNYLSPIDNDQMIRRNNIEKSLFNVQRLINLMGATKPRVMIIILDACRRNIPLTKANTMYDPSEIVVKPGLGVMSVPPGTIIAYACAANEVSIDRSKYSQNGVYTHYLLQHIKTPNIDIDLVLRRVAIDVQIETKNLQVPFRYSSCNEIIFLAHQKRRHRPRQDDDTTEPVLEESEKKHYIRMYGVNPYQMNALHPYYHYAMQRLAKMSRDQFLRGAVAIRQQAYKHH